MKDFIKLIPSKEDIQKAIKKNIDESTVEIVSDNKVIEDTKKPSIVDWNNIKLTYKDKNVLEWNKKDFLKYFFREYHNKYGNYPGRLTAWPVNFQSIQKIEFMIEKILKKNCDNDLLKKFFDWIIEEDVNFQILKKNLSCTVNSFAKEKFIIQFMNSRFLKEKSVQIIDNNTYVENKKENDQFNISDLNNAYSIHSQFFVENYGIVITYWYLKSYLSKDESFIKNYILKAIDKIKDKNKISVIDKKYGPYHIEYKNDFLVSCDSEIVFSNEGLKL